MVMPAIQVENLRKEFGKVTALSDLSFQVQPGEVFALLGPNGAGKTTAVRILTTNVVPDSGRAVVLGFDTAQQASQVRARIGLAGQFATVDGTLTGRENLRLIGRLTHLPKRELTGRVAELLGRFGLDEAADRPAKTYSGGMRRRLDIAAALLHRPPVLFLDEPTTGLDLESRLALWDMVRELVAAGTTVLLTTQYLEEADQLANRITIVNGGRVVAEGTPGELKSRTGASVLELGFENDEMAERACAVLGRLDTGAPQREGSTVLLPAADGARLTMHAMTLLDGEGLVPARLALREPSLDDAFLALTSTGPAAVETSAAMGRS